MHVCYLQPCRQECSMHICKIYLACGVTSSDADVGDGKRSTSTFGSALMAASRTLGRRCSGGEGEMGGGGGEEHGDSGTTGVGLAGGVVGDS